MCLVALVQLSCVCIYIFHCVSPHSKTGSGNDAGKGGAKAPDKKGKGAAPPVEASSAKKTTLKRRGDPEPSEYLGMCSEWECVCLNAQ